MQDDPVILCASIMDSLAIPYCIIGGYAVACHGVPRHPLRSMGRSELFFSMA